MAWEAASPLRAAEGMPLWRWLNNLAVTAVDYAVLLGVTPWLGLLVANQTGMDARGVLNHLDADPWLSFLVLLICLQFVGYWLHRAFHHFPILWRIHAVHHCDPEVDATTAHRHHPLEYIINSLVMLPVVVALGPDPMTILSYNVAHAIMAIVSHGNISLGPVDRLLRPFIVTPAFHRLHHSADQRYTDSNYSALLPVFDYLFRTATRMPLQQQRHMQLGLSYFRDRKYARLDRLLLIPFLPGLDFVTPDSSKSS